MVTSKSDADDIVSCLKTGANDYITKPINFEIALSRINTHIQLAELSLEMSRVKEMMALDAMITTYNHEINNPLAIALSCLSNDGGLKENESGEKLKKALWRIADIVKKIREVTEKKEVDYASYTSASKLVKLK